MFGLYKQLLPELGGYLTHAGELSRTRLETFMGKLAEAEADVLQSRAEVGGTLHAAGRMHCFLSCVSHCCHCCVLCCTVLILSVQATNLPC